MYWDGCDPSTDILTRVSTSRYPMGGVENLLLPLWLLDGVALFVDEAFRAHHLEGIVERIQLGLRGAVRAEIGVGPGEVLSVVDGEVHVVQGVMGGAVEEFLRPVAGNHVAVVNQDGPDLDRAEEDHVQMALHGADKDEDAVKVSQDCQSSRGIGRLTGMVETARTHPADGTPTQPTGWELQHSQHGHRGNREML